MPVAWQAVLGPTMHYNFGTRVSDNASDDAESCLNNTVRSLYPWIPVGSSVLDAGCGWGGPARLLVDERQARVHGVTVSDIQAEFFRTHVPEATCTCEDLAQLDLSEDVDVTIALESLTHVDQVGQALGCIRNRTDRLIIRDHVSKGPGFNMDHWRMQVPAVVDFRTQIEQAGFSITHEELVDVPWECVAKFWYCNIKSAFPLSTPKGHFSVLEQTCADIITNGPPQLDIGLFVAE